MSDHAKEHVFLVAYDYGMGGLWGAVVAPNEEAIAALYPELTVVHDRPAWMTDDRFDRICDTELHHINGAPWGILNAVLDDRRKRENARLSPSIKKHILAFPEYQPGTHRVALVMKDGNVIENVIVADGDKVIRVGETEGCPIVVAAVADAEDRS